MLGWEPTRTLDQILDDVIEYRRTESRVDQSAVGLLD